MLLPRRWTATCRRGITTAMNERPGAFPQPKRSLRESAKAMNTGSLLRRLMLYAGLGAAALALMGMLAVMFWLYTVTRDLPSVEALKNYSPPVTTRVYAGNGAVLGEYASQSRIF